MLSRETAGGYVLGLAVLLVVSAAGATTQAQTLEARISVTSVAPARLHIEGRRADATKAWSFLDAYAGAANLSARIENLALSDAAGAEVPVRRLAQGEYEAARPANRFRYDLKLDPPEFLSDASHVSWLAADRGMLLPADLLPLHRSGSKLALELPAGWTIATAETKNMDGLYEAADASLSVFFVGRSIRERHARAGAMDFTVAAAGDWAFGDEDFTRAITATLDEYVELIGGAPRRRALIILSPFPKGAPGSSWSAETRGGTVVLLSGLSPSKVAALAQLGNTLAHELLHLWVPNGLGLKGEYDWFYEGFTLYQAMRVGIGQGELSFQDYLNALGRAFDGYRAARGRDELSLVEASRRRWTVSSALVYNKGMLVAFLYDLTLRQQTGGKRSVSDVYRELYQRHGGTEGGADGSRAVIDILNRLGGMEGFTKLYIESPVAIDLERALAPFGLRAETVGARTQVTVIDSLNRSQRDLLSKLGYNERADAATRKLHEILKKRRQQ